jgi:hypothetical protein
MHRRLLLGGALIAGIAAASWEYGSEPATAALAKTGPPPARGRAPVEQLPELELEKLELDKSPEPITNAFEPRSWAPPPPKINLPPPPPPQAPPLPYTYIGKMVEEGQTVVFLTRQERNYAVRSGDKLDNIYQVDDIKSNVMLLTYLPLNLQQSLMIGSTN